MKSITYNADHDTDISASLTEFISELRRFLPFQKLPPLEVLNQYLRVGEIDQGMSGSLRWEPLAITESEYQEVASDLGLTPAVKPSNVNSEVDWFLWCFQEYLGVPMEEHRKYHEILMKLDQECQLAYDNEDDNADELHLKYIEASNQLNEFLNKYIS